MIVPSSHRKIIRRALWHGVVPAIVLSMTLSGCVYFNTMYNAKRHFKNAEKQNAPDKTGARRVSTNKRLYDDAITKAAKIVQKHPKSKYHDDALFLIGVSYFRMDNYSKSESAFRELLAVHPKSEFVDESQLYLARCRMELGDEPAAYRAFSDLARNARKKEWRAEATYQRGLYLSGIGQVDSAAIAYQVVLDSFPDSDRATDARLREAEALRAMKRPQDAMALYQPLVEKKDPLERYPALIGLGEACYERELVDSGIAIFEAMVEEEAYADSLGNIRIRLGDGYERRGDTDAAWRQYEQVTAVMERTIWSAEAYFNMAEIKQYQHNDLVSAKEYYDKVRAEYATGELASQALTRSANITKLGEFRKTLGRGGLTSESATENLVYDPENLPRLERLERSSPSYARPADFVHSSLRTSGTNAEPLLTSRTDPDKPSTAEHLGPPTPEELEDPWQNPEWSGPATPPELMWTVDYDSTGSPTGVAGTQVSDSGFFGPPVDPVQLIQNEREVELLATDVWLKLIGSDSSFGPPSPARYYDFGNGDLLGPITPDEMVFAAAKPIEIDSTAIKERAERAALREQRKEAFSEIAPSAVTQLQLAELYRYDLAYPESALVEYADLVQRYPQTPYAAQALLASADILRNQVGDSAKARDCLERILKEYPRSDYAGDAIAKLGWENTNADTAHPLRIYREAEDKFLLDDNPKEAIRLFRRFVEEYPYSRLVPRAEYAIAYLTDRYFPGEDSTVVWAYQELSSAYPQTEIATAVGQRLNPVVNRPKPRAAPVLAKKDEKKVTADGKQAGENEDDSTEAVKLPLAPRPKYMGQVEFPSADVNVIIDVVVVVYKILINYSGQVDQLELIKKSPSADLDEATRRAVEVTTFWNDSIPPESLNMWYRYEVRVTPPARDYDPNNPVDVYNRTIEQQRQQQQSGQQP